MKFDYNIHPDNNSDAFLKAVDKIKMAFPNIYENDPVVDVDGSVTRTFIQDGKKIKAHDDYYVGAVYVESDIDLNHLFH